MTESTAVGTRGFNSKSLKKYTSVGLLAPNMQAKVISTKTGSCLPPGSSGELLLRGPAIMKGIVESFLMIFPKKKKFLFLDYTSTMLMFLFIQSNISCSCF